jgi:hypothetical protein
MIVVNGKYVGWTKRMFKQLQKELIRWTTSHTKMLRGTIKVDPKKDVCHFAVVIEVLMQHLFLEIEP